MQRFKRFFCALLSLVLSLGVFSTSVYADVVDTSTYKVNIYSFETFLFKGMGQLDLNNGQTGYKETTKTASPTSSITKLRFQQQLSFVDTQGGAIFKSGKIYSFNASNFVFRYSYTNNDGYATEQDRPTKITDAYIVYDNSETEKVDATVSYVERYYTYTVNVAKIQPKRDVVRLVICVGDERSAADLSTPSSTAYFEMGTKAKDVDYNAEIEISVQSEEAGLLSGILGWLTNLFDSVTEGFANIGQWFAELPGKIWSIFEEGIKSLFVPPEGAMAEYQDKWDSLLSTRLGAVYQVGQIVTDSWDQIESADALNTINMPAVTIPVGGDTTFTFGGYDVQIIPEGFEVLVEALKIIVGILCTYLFVNGLLKRYDEVMGVER